MDAVMNEVRQEIGKVVEESGKLLQSETPLTRKQLTDLRDKLNSSAVIVQQIRDTRLR